MNDLIENERDNKYPILVSIRLSEGAQYEQPLELDSDGAQSFMDWFRDKKSGDVWTWQIPSEQKIKLFHRWHITAVEIDGYIEPEGKESKWYHRVLDKIKSRLFLFIHKRMWNHAGKEKIHTETRQPSETHHEV